MISGQTCVGVSESMERIDVLDLERSVLVVAVTVVDRGRPRAEAGEDARDR